MRTTLTLDDDVARLLEKETRRTGASFKEVVNRALRLGLTTSRQVQRKPFVVTPIKMGLPPGLSYDCVQRLMDAIEEDPHR